MIPLSPWNGSSHPHGALLLHIEYSDGEGHNQLPVLLRHKVRDRPFYNSTDKTWDKPIAWPSLVDHLSRPCAHREADVTCSILSRSKIRGSTDGDDPKGETGVGVERSSPSGGSGGQDTELLYQGRRRPARRLVGERNPCD